MKHGHSAVTHDHSLVTTVDQTGLWSLTLMLAQGGPYNITFIQKIQGRWQKSLLQVTWGLYGLGCHNDIYNSDESPDDNVTVELTNVLSGDVWLCVGSDDMGLPVASLVNSTQEIEAALNLTQVRPIFF